MVTFSSRPEVPADWTSGFLTGVFFESFLSDRDRRWAVSSVSSSEHVIKGVAAEEPISLDGADVREHGCSVKGSRRASAVRLRLRSSVLSAIVGAREVRRVIVVRRGLGAVKIGKNGRYDRRYL